MGLTDNCDIYGSFDEGGFNNIIAHIMSQRPSLFNYATAQIAKNQELLCSHIKAHPIVQLRNNPTVTIVDPLPIPGTKYGVNFVAQIVDLKIDFHPSNLFELPPELKPPLEEQHFAIKLSLCGGLGCPNEDLVHSLIPTPSKPDEKVDESDSPREKEPLIPLPTKELICFCLDAIATGQIQINYYDGKPYLEPLVDSFEIVDIKPEGLENNLECYIGLMLKLVVLPGLRILLQHAPLNLTQGATDFFPTSTNVVLSPMPESTALPNNPSIEKDQLHVFIKLEVI